MPRLHLAVPVLATVVAVVAGLLGSPASAAGGSSRYERQVVRQLNVHRDASGVRPVRAGRCADRFAERWARRLHRGGAITSVRAARRRCGGVAHVVAVARRRHQPSRMLRALDDTRRGHRALTHRRVRRVGVGTEADRRGRWTVVVVLTGPTRAVARPRDGSHAAALPEGARRFIRQIYAATNAERAAHDLRPLTVSRCAARFGQEHSEWMAATGRFRHADIRAMFDRCDTTAAGENIAYTHRADGDHVVGLWMDSRGHRRNILDPEFTHIGVGVVHDPSTGRWYVTQDFTNGPH